MPEPVSTPAARPWRDGLAAGVAAALIAGLIVAVIDAAMAGFATLPALVALWAPIALALGVLAGVVVAGFRATFGEGALGAGLRRLREDRALDVAVTGAMLASVVVAGVLIVVVGAAARNLVVGRERVDTGLRLLGIVVVIAVPLVALLGLPVFRATRRVAAALPGRPRALWIVMVGGLGAVALGLFVVFTQLDWRALNLGSYGLFGGLFLGTIAIVLLGRGPLDAVRRAVPARGVVVAAAAVAAVALPFVVLRGTPSREVQGAVTDQAVGGAALLRVYRGLLDSDKDGYSGFFGGPDCDDGNKARYRGATDKPDNDVDEDCNGEDYHAPVKTAGSGDGTGSGMGAGTGTGTGSGAAPAKAALAPDANILILMVDTVRADRLGVAGYQRDGQSLTPRIDAFAAQSVRFTHAYSVAANTPRAMPAFMTSRYPSVIDVDKQFKNYPSIGDKNVMLFEVLKDAGVGTFGFMSHYYFRDDRNFGQGFDLYDNEGALDTGPANKDTAADRIVPKVITKLETLAASKQRFAMWVHLFEPHSTYMEHDGFPSASSKGLRGTESLKHKYDYEIAYTDKFVGQILDTLDATQLTANTIVVIVSDHGEAFGVHRIAGQGMMFHGQTLYDELLHIPLVVRAPGVAPATVDAVVSLIDVAPTLLDAIGVPTPPTFMGRSLVPALRGQALEPKPAFAELIPYPNWDHAARAVIAPDGRWKMVDRTSENTKEVYDLVEDKEERKDRYDAKDPTTQLLDGLLQEFVNVTLPGAPQP